MTTRRVARLIPSIALAVLILAPASGARFRSPSVSLSPSPSPSSSSNAVLSTGTGGEVVEEIARDTVIEPPGSQPDTAVEPFVAVDPALPDRLVAVFQMG